MAWAVRALTVNELKAERWSDPMLQAGISPPPGISVDTTVGQAVMLQFQIPDSQAWVWGAVGFLWGGTLLLTACGAVALVMTNPPEPQPSVPAEEISKEVAKGVVERMKRVSEKLSNAVQVAAATIAGHRDAERGTVASDSRGLVSTVAFTPVTLVCRDIRYFVDLPKGAPPPPTPQEGTPAADPDVAGKLELLKGVSFHAEPGVLTALMGGSGAGKTTLMDVVAGRKTQGVIKGKILVNGYPKEQATWSRVIGLVPFSFPFFSLGFFWHFSQDSKSRLYSACYCPQSGLEHWKLKEESVVKPGAFYFLPLEKQTFLSSSFLLSFCIGMLNRWTFTAPVSPWVRVCSSAPACVWTRPLSRTLRFKQWSKTFLPE
jgi:hypothetical protein